MTMTLTEALEWCVQSLAVVSFISNYGTPRVRVKAAGGNTVERGTFIEAVEAAKTQMERLAAAREADEAWRRASVERFRAAGVERPWGGSVR